MSDSDVPPPPIRFFRIIILRTFSRHRIESQWFTSIFFYCSNLRVISPTSRTVSANERWLFRCQSRGRSPLTCQRPNAPGDRLWRLPNTRDTKPLVASVRCCGAMSSYESTCTTTKMAPSRKAVPGVTDNDTMLCHSVASGENPRPYSYPGAVADCAARNKTLELPFRRPRCARPRGKFCLRTG